MAATHLAFNLDVIGSEKVNAALQGIEARFVKMQSSLNAILSKENKAAVQTVANQAKVAAAAQNAQNKVAANAAREEQRLHAMKMRDEEKLAALRASNEMKLANMARREAERVANSRRRFSEGSSSSIGSVAGKAGSMAGSFAQRAAQGATALVTGTIVAAARDQLSAQQIAAKIANQAYGNEGENRSLSELNKAASDTMTSESRRTGISREDVGTTIQAGMAASGDLAGVSKLLPGLNDLSQAFGIAAEDMGTLGGKLWAQAKKNTALKTDDERKDFVLRNIRLLGQQGKTGSIELSEQAAKIGKFTSQTPLYFGDEFQKVKEFGALAQLSVDSGGASGIEETGTAASSLTSELLSRSKLIKKLTGVDTIKDGKINGSPAEIIRKIVEGSKGDPTKIVSMFGEQSRKLLIPVMAVYNKAKKEGKDPNKAMEELFDSFGKELSQKQVDEMASNTRNTDAAQLEAVWNELKVVIGEELAPTIKSDLIPAIRQAAPMMKDLVSAGIDLIPTLLKLGETASSLAKLMPNDEITKQVAMIAALTIAFGGLNIITLGLLGVMASFYAGFKATTEALGFFHKPANEQEKQSYDLTNEWINASNKKDPEERKKAREAVLEKGKKLQEDIVTNQNSWRGYAGDVVDVIGTSAAHAYDPSIPVSTQNRDNQNRVQAQLAQFQKELDTTAIKSFATEIGNAAQAAKKASETYYTIPATPITSGERQGK